jgi:hypothetical protein
MANNTLKYKRLEPHKRARELKAWNKPIVWPLLSVAALLGISVIPAFLVYLRRERSAAL